MERTLNSLDNKTLNDYLHKIYYSKKPDTMMLMHRWINYFVKQHKMQIHVKVRNYLESKKLPMDEWLHSVNEARWGDILSVYILSIAT